MMLSIAAAIAPPAAAQIDSHCIPPEMPATLFPNWVAQLPPLESQEMSAPLLTDTNKSRTAPAAKTAGTQGAPDATDLAAMCKEPREAIRLAEAGRFLEAARAGDALLEGPRDRYRDFTWDYLANATAWSFIQTGDLLGATRAHTAAAARLDDLAVSEYHNRIAKMLSSPGRTAASLKDYAAYKAEVQKLIDERSEALKKAALPGSKIVLEKVRVGTLNDAYRILRVIAAFDKGAAKQEAKNTFVPAAQGLVNDVLPARFHEGEEILAVMDKRMDQWLHLNEYKEWNGAVEALWLKVREIKRLCRMHDYLARMDLADKGGDEQFFTQAHGLLFVPKEPTKVWQEMGHTRTVNNISQWDIRIKVPYKETLITPMGVPFTGRLAPPPNSWRVMDGKFNPMTEQMHGGFRPMTDPTKR
jgi:hypothetical protein